MLFKRGVLGREYMVLLFVKPSRSEPVFNQQIRQFGYAPGGFCILLTMQKYGLFGSLKKNIQLSAC
jgi:hypothetical protein